MTRQTHATVLPVWGIVTLLGFCLIVLFLRKPDQWSNPQFWAEDGFFYQSALTEGWSALLQPYNGYLHTVPRLIAATAWWFDPVHAPAWFVGCAAAGSLYVAGRALSRRQPLRCRPALALAIVCVPDAFEVLLNVTNLQWLLAAALFLLLLSTDPERWPGRLHDLTAALLLGLTGPFSVLLAPFFVIRALLRKSPFSWVLAGIVAAAAAIQTGCMLQYTQPAPADQTVAWLYGFSAIGLRLAGSLFLGQWVHLALPVSVRMLLAAVTLAIIGLAAARTSGIRSARALLAAAFVVLLAASLYRCRWVLEPLNQPGYGARYFFPLQLILLWMLIDAISDRRRRWRWSALTLVALAFVANLPRLREPALADLRWRDYAGRIRAGEALVVPINPAGWTITFPARPAQP